MKSFLQNNNKGNYSTNDEGISIIAEISIRSLKKKICKNLTSVSKNEYIDKLDDIVNKYNNTYLSIHKLKPVDVKSNTYTDSSKGINNEDPEFKIGGIVRISKYKNIFGKTYTPDWSEKVFVIKKVKNTVPWTYLISHLKAEKTVGMSCEKKNCKKQIKKTLELKM